MRFREPATTLVCDSLPCNFVPAEIYFRFVPTFQVSDPALAWFTESVFIGTGARFPDRVELAFYRVG